VTTTRRLDDLFIAYSQNVLYHNTGNGTFTDVSEKAGSLETASGGTRMRFC